MLKALFKFLLWVLVLGVLGAGLYAACAATGRPPELALAGMAALLALALGWALLRRCLARRARLRSIQRIVGLEHKSFEDVPQENRLLKNRWRRAVALLRASYLGRFGNPVYALPWHMVIGGSGAGKSSAIRFSGLSAMQTDVGPEQGHGRTRNCDWWFFREAVVLDTAGRYALPENEAADGAEWREFLELLGRHRRREPLNGLVAAIAADRLGEGSIKDEARCLRLRIDEIMRVTGACFPVYLMITKIDLIAGMAGVIKNLPEGWKRQCAGVIMQSPEKPELTPVALQVARAMEEMAERFRSICLFNPASALEPRPQALLAAGEIKALAPAVCAFAEEMFTENPYQETPLLRGIFFSSALHGAEETRGKAFSRLEELARRLIRAEEYRGGIFLNDFFGRILPGDRRLYRPIAEYLRWRSMARTGAYALMLLILFGAGALLSLSFRANEQILRGMGEAAESVSGLNAAGRLFDFERRYRRAESVDEALAGRRLPWMGLTTARDAAARANAALNAAFEREIMNRIDQDLMQRRSVLTAKTDDMEYAMLMSDLLWRHDLLKELATGAGPERLMRLIAAPRAALSVFGLENIPSLAQPMAYCVAMYYAKSEDEARRGQLMRALRASLARMPALKNYSLTWIVGRANSVVDAAIKGGQFWTGEVSGELDEARVEPAFTAAGAAAIAAFINELVKIAGEPELGAHAREFQAWYATRYITEWKRFAGEFARRLNSMSGKIPGNDAMVFMASTQNPFFALALRMDEEIQAVIPWLEKTPPWVADLSAWADAMRLAVDKSPQTARDAGLLQRLGASLGNARDEAVAQFNEGERRRRAHAQHLTEDHLKYIESLGNMVKFTLSDEMAFQALGGIMPTTESEAPAASPLNLGKTACAALTNRINPSMAEDSPVKQLAEGPWAFFMDRMAGKASCQAQTMWEDEVLSKAGSMSPQQLQQELFAEPGGLARQFADKSMKLFLRRSALGYQPRKADGHALSFTHEFLGFLNDGMLHYTPTQQEYPITIAAVPVDVNEECHEKPHAATLILDCAREKQELVNYNSPAQKQFVWREGSCGDVSLTIRFKSAALKINYPGEQGFVNFLQEFQDGNRTFTLDEFPEQAAILKSIGFTEVTVRYTFNGSEPLLRSRSYVPGTLPFVISSCRR